MQIQTLQAGESATLKSLTREDIKYGDMVGHESFRKALAAFINHFVHIPQDLLISADQVTIHNGCGSAVESLFHVLCDSGDIVLIPSPYYGGFDMDLERRAQVRLCPVECGSTDGFYLSRESLEQTWDRAQNLLTGKNSIRALLIMNPVNPTGVIYNEETLRVLSDFCEQHNLHLVMDEIYILSTFRSERAGRTF